MAEQKNPRLKPLFALLALALAHLLLPMRWGDDAVFFEKVKAVGLPAFLRTSSRVLVDSATYLFATCPILWRVLNPLVLFGLYCLLVKLLNVSAGRQKLCLGLLVLGLSMGLADAGFMATTVNYLWPVTFGLFAVYSLLRFEPGGKRAWLRCALALPALLYAVNMQQLGFALPVVFALLLCLVVKQKRALKSVLAGVYLLISLAGAGAVLYRSVAGENARLAREAARYFPGFAGLSLFQRAELGFSSTFHGLAAALCVPGVFFLGFCVFLAVTAWKRSLPVWAELLSLLPPAGIVILLCLRTRLPLVNPKMGKAEYLFSWPLDLVFALLGLAAAITIFLLIRQKSDRPAAFFVLALGLASRVLMGFSPTVWASGYRTFYLLLLALIAVGYYIIKEPDHESIACPCPA